MLIRIISKYSDITFKFVSLECNFNIKYQLIDLKIVKCHKQTKQYLTMSEYNYLQMNLLTYTSCAYHTN